MLRLVHITTYRDDRDIPAVGSIQPTVCGIQAKVVARPGWRGHCYECVRRLNERQNEEISRGNGLILRLDAVIDALFAELSESSKDES